MRDTRHSKLMPATWESVSSTVVAREKVKPGRLPGGGGIELLDK